jgi:hypothetical protein
MPYLITSLNFWYGQVFRGLLCWEGIITNVGRCCVGFTFPF